LCDSAPAAAMHADSCVSDTSPAGSPINEWMHQWIYQ
jgi:hypothetical protein